MIEREHYRSKGEKKRLAKVKNGEERKSLVKSLEKRMNEHGY